MAKFQDVVAPYITLDIGDPSDPPSAAVGTVLLSYSSDGYLVVKDSGDDVSPVGLPSTVDAEDLIVVSQGSATPVYLQNNVIGCFTTFSNGTRHLWTIGVVVGFTTGTTGDTAEITVGLGGVFDLAGTDSDMFGFNGTIGVATIGGSQRYVLIASGDFGGSSVSLRELDGTSITTPIQDGDVISFNLTFTTYTD